MRMHSCGLTPAKTWDPTGVVPEVVVLTEATISQSDEALNETYSGSHGGVRGSSRGVRKT